MILDWLLMQRRKACRRYLAALCFYSASSSNPHYLLVAQVRSPTLLALWNCNLNNANNLLVDDNSA